MKKTRRRRFSIVLILALVVMAGALWLQLLRPKVYYGRTIDGWIQQLCNAYEYGEAGNAIDRLTEIGEPAVDRLVAALTDEEPFYMPGYRKLWSKLPAGTQTILPNPPMYQFSDKRDIFRALAAIDVPSGEVFAVFQNGATNIQWDLQFEAVQNIRYFSPTNGMLFLPILTNALYIAPDNVRGAAAAVFGTWGTNGAVAIPELLNRLSSPRDPAFQNSSVDSRIHVANSLASIGLATPQVLDALSGAMGDANPRLRLYSARAMYRLTGDVEPALSVVGEVLKNGDDETRSAAISVASSFGTNAARLMPVIETFNPLIEVPLQVDVANFVWKAFGNAGSTMRILNEAMMSGNRQYQLGAVRVIADMATEADATVSSLIHVISTDQDWLVQDRSVTALAKMGMNAVSALPALTNLLDHRVLRVQRSAASAIEAISIHKFPP